ncbi:MAG: hypothetical protein NC201_00945 [Prevotella sp.]|nr:hypothetical protein [Bacteroides sp.]MCM1365793.1 hypothetical protein [Prevotella sp.]MCM1436515.1 hypothetical protein [Prevotella sp.]
MENNQIQSNNQEPVQFHGYTLDEIRYQRALSALQREFAKEKIISQVTKIRKRGVFGLNEKPGTLAKAGGVASKILGGLNYVDYALIGFSAFSTIRKVFKFFRRK